MRKLLEFYKNLIREGYIEGIKIDVYKRINQPQPQQDDEDLQIPKFEYITGFVSTTEMDDFQDDAIDALDHLNYYNIQAFEFKQHNMNEVMSPVLIATIVLVGDEDEI